MEEPWEDKVEALKHLARMDWEYRKLERKLLWLECELSEIVGSLTEYQQDIVWEYLILSASQDRRLLEKALSLIDFSKDPLGRGAVLTDAGSGTEAGFPPNGDT